MRLAHGTIQGVGVALLLAVAGSPGAWAKVALPTSLSQGETIELKFSDSDFSQTEGGASPNFAFNGHSYPLYKAEDANGSSKWQGLLAIPCDLSPGVYPLKVNDESYELKVKAGKFPLQRISLPKSKDNFDMSPHEKEKIDAAKATLSPARHWHDKFIPPCAAPQSAKFGMKRVVNGRLLKDYYHTGLDFAAPLGKTVCACAPGTVILACKGFKLHGNTVAIDHGQGVISFYIHLNQIVVKEGQEVDSGEKIATVGQTGRATGPHLHFGIYVNQTASNPNQWLTTTF
ncbi:MAG: peptidase [Candidatus Melainabacteria bacterium]|nr:MAG: peptidase [Candidatus Melainabacteria bacterium]